MKINKRIAVSGLTIAGVLTAVVGITLAQFTDTATLSSNVLDTATPNLKIASGAGCPTFSTSATGINPSATLKPGESESKPFCLRNDSDGTLSFNITGLGHITSGSLDPDLVTVTVDCIGGTGPQVIPLNDTSSANIYLSLAPTQTANCTITQTLSGSATNGASNKTLHYTVTFTGEQA